MSVAQSPVSSTDRPEPPADLTPEQRIEWALVVNSAPADWFAPYNHSVLAQYCRHAVAARRVAQLIQQFESQDGFDVSEYDRLLKMQERESRVISSLLTKLRLTPQSIYSARKPAETVGDAMTDVETVSRYLADIESKHGGAEAARHLFSMSMSASIRSLGNPESVGWAGCALTRTSALTESGHPGLPKRLNLDGS
jgi:hypothetical protein